MRPLFGSGPCVKPYGFHWSSVSYPLVGRSHRSASGVHAVNSVIERLKQLLEIPQDYHVALVPASSTGAVEMGLWNFLGQRPVDVIVWDVFSQLWASTLQKQLHLETHIIQDELPHAFEQTHPEHDLVLTWCGTTSGLWVGPQSQWLPREGLVICDAASAVLTTILPWRSLDITAFSWQKAFGGEASTGILVLSPKAMAHLERYTPSWPIPRLLRLKTLDGDVLHGLFRGETINTISLFLIQEEQALLDFWLHHGGLSHAISKTDENYETLVRFVQSRPWLCFVVENPLYRARGPVLLRFGSWFSHLSVPEQWRVLHNLESEFINRNIAFDFLNHAHSFPALRLWCGPNVEPMEIMTFLSHLECWVIEKKFTRVLD